MTIAQKCGGGVSTGIVACWKLSTAAVAVLPESPTMMPCNITVVLYSIK